MSARAIPATRLTESVTMLLDGIKYYDQFATHCQSVFKNRVELLDLPTLVQEAASKISLAKLRFWDSYFLFRSVEGPKSPRIVRLEAISAEFTGLRGDIATLKEVVVLRDTTRQGSQGKRVPWISRSRKTEPVTGVKAPSASCTCWQAEGTTGSLCSSTN
jgi:hypothetical protein